MQIAALAILFLVFSALRCNGKLEKADESFLKHQLAVLKLTWHFSSPIQDPDQKASGNLTNTKSIKSFDPLQNLNLYKNPVIVEQYFHSAKTGQYLPRGQDFDPHNLLHLFQALHLFEVLYFTPDWDTFYKTALASRDITNEQQFYYALFSSLWHRDENILLPPIYECIPNLLSPLTKRSATKAKNLKRKCQGEQRMSLLYDDPELNEQRMMWHMMWPSWWLPKFGDTLHRRGERYWYMYHQLLNRVDSERFANGLHELKPFDSVQRELKDIRVADLEAYEERIREAISAGFVITELDHSIVSLNDTEGTVNLGVQLDAPSSTVYPSYSRQLGEVSRITRMRDPHRQYKLYKRQENLFMQQKYNTPPYDKEDLSISGVEIKSLSVDDLITIIEEHDIQAVVQDISGTRSTKIRRLNHHPFDVNMIVDSATQRDVIGRIFMAPKFDSSGKQLSLDQQAWKFIELDQFSSILKPGENHITRHSLDFTRTSATYPSTKTLIELLENALTSQKSVDLVTYRH